MAKATNGAARWIGIGLVAAGILVTGGITIGQVRENKADIAELAPSIREIELAVARIEVLLLKGD